MIENDKELEKIRKYQGSLDDWSNVWKKRSKKFKSLKEWKKKKVSESLGDNGIIVAGYGIEAPMGIPILLPSPATGYSAKLHTEYIPPLSHNEKDKPLKKIKDKKLRNSLKKSLINLLKDEKSSTLESIKGGLADKIKTLEDLYLYWREKLLKNKKGYPKNLKNILESNLEMGIKVEMEHTDKEQIAREIAMDHLMEMYDYYEKLKEIEK